MDKLIARFFLILVFCVLTFAFTCLMGKPFSDNGLINFRKQNLAHQNRLFD